MKRSQPVVIVALLATLLLSACGGSQQAPASAPKATSPASPPAQTAAPSTPPSTPAPAKTQVTPIKVMMGYCCTSTTVLPVIVAERKGFFQEEGVDFTFQQFLQGSATVIQALAAGEIDLAVTIGGPDSVIRAAQKGAKIKMVGSGASLVPFWLYGKKEIAKLADAKGKTMVFGGLGGPGWTFAAAMLEHSGLKTTDVNVIQNGNDGQRLGLLVSGQADVAILNLPQNFKAEARGFHQLAWIGDAVSSTVQVMGASDKVIAQNPAAITRVLKALTRSIAYIQAQPEDVAKIYSEWGKFELEDARRAVKINTPLYSLGLNHDKMRVFLEMAKKVDVWKDPLPTNAELDKYVDYRFLKEMGIQ